MVIYLSGGNIAIEISLGNDDNCVLARIFENLKFNRPTKQSESENFISLSSIKLGKNLSDLKKISDSQNSNININEKISKIIHRTLDTDSTFEDNLEILSKRIKFLLKKRMKNNLLNHAEYIKIAIQELRSVNLSIQLELAKDCIFECIKNDSLK